MGLGADLGHHLAVCSLVGGRTVNQSLVGLQVCQRQCIPVITNRIAVVTNDKLVACLRHAGEREVDIHSADG